ncbi:MAG: hypothetical protein JWO44_205 [Bacteroidetes bacterium]|nr:hypothetical protein [Bacteroidota bacterium]
MKAIKTTFSLLFISITLFAQQDKDYSLAKVGKQVLGVYIFVACEPANEYDYIATIDVRWHEGDPDKSFLELIERGKKKYPNFNAIIFKNAKFETADLVKFRNLEITGGGFRVGDNAVYKEDGRPKYGQILQLDNTKQKAGFKYLDEYGEEKLNTVAYSKLSMITAEQYSSLIEQQNVEIQKHKFIIGEKTSWSDDKKPCYGEVVSLNNKNHDATVKYYNIYGEEKTTVIDFLKLEKFDELRYSDYIEKQKVEIQKHQFTVGQKISYIDDKIAKYGEVAALDNNSHKATLKYIDIFGEVKTVDVKYLDIEKVSEEKFQEEIKNFQLEILKYKFSIGEKISWSKTSVFTSKSEIILAEIVALNDLEHKATIKYFNKDNIEKQENVSYLDLSKLK